MRTPWVLFAGAVVAVLLVLTVAVGGQQWGEGEVTAFINDKSEVEARAPHMVGAPVQAQANSDGVTVAAAVSPVRCLAASRPHHSHRSAPPTHTQFAVNALNQEHPADGAFTLVRVSSATTQVVAGIK